MKRSLVLILLTALYMTACASETPLAEPPPAESLPAQESSESVNEAAAPIEEAVTELTGEEPAAEDLIVLPSIPEVTYVDTEWFDPTPPDQINLANGSVQLFDFSAIWCSNCRYMAPIVAGLEQLYGDQVNFVMLDMDKSGADEYGPFIDALNYNPAFRPGIFIIAPDGTVLNAWLGPVDGIVLQEALVLALQTYQ